MHRDQSPQFSPLKLLSVASTCAKIVAQQLRSSQLVRDTRSSNTVSSNIFFLSPTEHGALTGNFTEVPCSQWTGNVNTTPLWNGACIAPNSAPLWPSVACGNQGLAPGYNGVPASTVS